MESIVFWNKEKKILTTKISGTATLEKVKEWKKQNFESFLKIDENEKFLVLYDSSGYEFDNIETHKYFRKIIPEILIQYNNKLSFIDDEDAELVRKEIKRKTQCCVGVALLHHDVDKMRLYSENYENDNEGFFSNIKDAEKWLEEKSNTLN